MNVLIGPLSSSWLRPPWTLHTNSICALTSPWPPLSLSLSATLLMASFISLSLSAETEVRCVLQETKAAVALEDLYCPSWWKALQVTHEVKAISFSLTAAWRWRETAAVTYEFVREWWGRTWVRRISLEQGLPPSLSSLTSCGSGLNASPHFTLFYTRETD